MTHLEAIRFLALFFRFPVSRMAAPRNKPRNKTKDRKPWPNEVLGILLCGGGILLLLSMVSYAPSDLANLWSGNKVNWIGPVGVCLGYAFLWSLGAAAYLLPICLLWMGVAKLLFDARPQLAHLAWLLYFCHQWCSVARRPEPHSA